MSKIFIEACELFNFYKFLFKYNKKLYTECEATLQTLDGTLMQMYNIG